jgi:hypothetical protein
VQAKIVKRQLQSISIVPRVSFDDTKFTECEGAFGSSYRPAPGLARTRGREGSAPLS